MANALKLKIRFAIEFMENITIIQNYDFSTIFMWITLIIHILACSWYLFACPLTYCRRKSWLTALNIKNKVN